ncbi:MAG: glycosyltransferase [Candidatus Jordarchaeaceae archaeon]
MLVSVGIIAFNEEKNINKLLNSLLNQRLNNVVIDEIIVVTSGSTDMTNKIVEEYSRKNSKIKLEDCKKRKGKASAVNEFLKVAKNKILVLESGDTVPGKETIEKLCLPFLNKNVGLVGAHPIPTNDKNTFMGYVAHLLWELHHHISSRNPKGGEMIAFRKLFDQIVEDTAVDESWIEYEIRKRGYKLAYSPEAIVYNRGPETLSEFFKQRRRVNLGHIDIRKRTKYRVSTTNLSNIISVIFKVFPYREVKKWLWFFSAIVLEALGKLLGYWDYYIKKRNQVIWEIAQTTKEVQI